MERDQGSDELHQEPEHLPDVLVVSKALASFNRALR